MRINRRQAFAIIAATAPFATSASAKTKIYRVNGQVGSDNYEGLQQFLFNSFGIVVGIRVRFEGNDNHIDGAVVASESGGQFVAYLAGPGGQSEIVADKGFSYQHGDFVFDGFYVVKSGGMHQGIISIYLEKTDDGGVLVSGAKIVDIDIDRLNPNIKG